MLTLQQLTIEQNTKHGLQQESRTEKFSYFKRWPHCTRTLQKSTIANQPTHKQQLNENYWREDTMLSRCHQRRQQGA